MPRARDIEVAVTFLPTEHGGRSSRAASGCQPQFHYDRHDWDAEHECAGVDRVELGQIVRAFVALVSPQEHVGKVVPGKPFRIREGQRVVGYAVVKAVPELELSAEPVRARRGPATHRQAV